MEKVPYLFSWFVPGKVAGMARPKNNQMNYLAQGGITVLVNLTREPSEYENDAKTVGITCVNISIADYYSPTVAQVKELIDLIEVTNKKDQAVGIHCSAGRGRTGAMLACYLVASEGYTANNAILETRKRRPDSIGTRCQEQAVHDYEKSLKETAD